MHVQRAPRYSLGASAKKNDSGMVGEILICPRQCAAPGGVRGRTLSAAGTLAEIQRCACYVANIMQNCQAVATHLPLMSKRQWL